MVDKIMTAEKFDENFDKFGDIASSLVEENASHPNRDSKNDSVIASREEVQREYARGLFEDVEMFRAGKLETMSLEEVRKDLGL